MGTRRAHPCAGRIYGGRGRAAWRTDLLYRDGYDEGSGRDHPLAFGEAFRPHDLLSLGVHASALQQRDGSDGVEGAWDLRYRLCLFSCQPMYQDLLDTLLGRTLIAEDLDAARRVAKKYGYRLRIVTRDGQPVNAGGSMTGGSMRKKENTYFGRRKEIADLYA